VLFFNKNLSKIKVNKGERKTTPLSFVHFQIKYALAVKFHPTSCSTPSLKVKVDAPPHLKYLYITRRLICNIMVGKQVGGGMAA
jgi:hypothetical protein